MTEYIGLLYIVAREYNAQLHHRTRINIYKQPGGDSMRVQKQTKSSGNSLYYLFEGSHGEERCVLSFGNDRLR